MESNILSQVEIFFDPRAVNERLLLLSTRTGYGYVQRNGQRYYGPPPEWTGPPPVRGSEIFIGRIPRDCFEDELVPVFESVAPIYEFRMMMNFTGYNRGFAFVTFSNPHDAWRAVLVLNNFEIRPGHKIGVFKSIDNCRLYVGGIPTDKTKSEVWQELTKVCPTVKEIIMYPKSEDRKKNRGFLFVEFDSHRTAAMAKRMMTPGPTQLWGKDVVVDWADPEPDVDPNIMAFISNLFIRNLPTSFTPTCIRHLLQDVVPGTAIQRIYVAGHYGFVHFDTRVHAQMAMDKLASADVNGEQLEVHWARPKIYKKTYAPHCRSIPPRVRRDRNNNTEHHQVQVHQVQMQPFPMPPPVRQLPPGPEHVADNHYKGPEGVQYTTVQYPVYSQPRVLFTPNPLSFYNH